MIGTHGDVFYDFFRRRKDSYDSHASDFTLLAYVSYETLFASMTQRQHLKH